METFFYLCGGSSFISLGHIYGRAYIGDLLIGGFSWCMGAFICVYILVFLYMHLCVGNMGVHICHIDRGGDVYLSLYL